MIIGPFWCETKKTWIRFITDEGHFFAEIALKNNDIPSLSVWKKEESQNDTWLMSYKHDSAETINIGLQLDKGALYHTFFSRHPYTKNLVIAQYDPNGLLGPYNIPNELFKEIILDPCPHITPYDQLPLTPEQQIEQANELQRIKDDKWARWQKQSLGATCHHDDFIACHADLGVFTKEQIDILLNESQIAFLSLSPDHYTSINVYLKDLEDAISNPNPSLLEKILGFAANTHLNEMLNETDVLSDVEFAHLYELKQLFIYALLEAERKKILHNFNMEVVPVPPAPIKKLTIPSVHMNHDTYILPAEEHQSPDISDAETFIAIATALDEAELAEASNREEDELQRALDLSFNYPQPQPYSEPQDLNWVTQPAPDIDIVQIQQSSSAVSPAIVVNEEDKQLNQAIKLSLEINNLPLSHPGILPSEIPSQQFPVSPDTNEENRLNIRNAVIIATAKYHAWYRGEQTHRGPNSLFNWFIHGDFGQARAMKFKNDIINSTCEEDAITQVNTLLQEKNTRYHRHSFSSFLLDELVLLKNLPWYGLSPDPDSNCYDVTQVTTHLSLMTGIAVR